MNVAQVAFVAVIPCFYTEHNIAFQHIKYNLILKKHFYLFVEDFPTGYEDTRICILVESGKRGGKRFYKGEPPFPQSSTLL